MEAGQELFDHTMDKTVEAIDPLKSWLSDNKRWFEERIMRAVAEYPLTCFGSKLPGGAYATKDGAAADFSFAEEGNELPPGAGVYFHWKLGSGMQVRMATNDYPAKPIEPLFRGMFDLVDRIQKYLETEIKPVRSRGLGVGKASCEIAHWELPSYSVAEIVEQLCSHLPSAATQVRKAIKDWATEERWAFDEERLIVYLP